MLMMGLQGCFLETCTQQRLARGLCSRHYQQWRKSYGSEIYQIVAWGEPVLLDHSPEMRFWAKVKKTDSCWLWTACTDRQGYGIFRNGPNIRAHHYLAGKAPPGLVWDHLCRQRNCVRPDHLEAVTNTENIARGNTGERNRIKTHCVRGHPFDGENTYLPPSGGRHCKACAKVRDHKRPSGWVRARTKR